MGSLSLDTTLLTAAMGAFALYYVALFVLLRGRRLLRIGAVQRPPSKHDPLVVVVIPAHNEELVIKSTIEALLEQRGVAPIVLVMNDGSSDRTSELARAYEATRYVKVVDRSPAIAGRGKGEVLNHAFRVLVEMVAEGDPLLEGRGEADILVGVVDADGALQAHALQSVVPYFDDPSVGAVQTGVSIVNARQGLLTRMQDMEFIGFSGYVQEARDAFGSVGLGGNGQFTRLAALRSMGRPPWTACLSEDLDLGLSIVKAGWRVRFCSEAFVLQQGLDRIKPLLRQRTRWFQGHYQCWSHLPSLVASDQVPLATKVDLSLYLLMIVLVVVIGAGAVTGLAAATGVIAVTNGILGHLDGGVAGRLAVDGLSLAPLLAFAWTYQRRSLHPLRPWELPAYMFAFVLYTYLLVAAQVWAWWRLARGRTNWAKTARLQTDA